MCGNAVIALRLSAWFFRSVQEDPLREAKFVHEILAATQAEEDEKRVLAGQPIVPYSLGREKWFSYDTKKAWWWKN